MEWLYVSAFKAYVLFLFSRNQKTWLVIESMIHDMSWHENAYRIAGPLWKESTSHGTVAPTQNASNAEFVCYVVEFACRPLGTKTLARPILTYCLMDESHQCGR